MLGGEVGGECFELYRRINLGYHYVGVSPVLRTGTISRYYIMSADLHEVA